MAYKTGIANGYKDLLMALKGFVENAKMAHNVEAGGGNVGNGYVSAERASTAPVDETWTLTATSATNFTVTGSVSGAQAAATVGTPYDNGIVAFTIVAGGTAFVATDSFTFDVEDGLGASSIWEVKRWNADYDGNGNYELILMGPGSGSDEIFAGIQTYGTTVLGYYNWKLQGYTGYAAGETFDNQPGAIPSNIPRMLCWNSPVPYWFFGNGRWFYVIAKVDTVYEWCGAGFYLSYGTPVQMSYPLFVGGSSTDANTSYTSDATSHRAFFNPGNASDKSTLLVYYNGWYHFCNFTSETIPTKTRNVWPFVYADSANSTIQWQTMKGAIDANPAIFPLILSVLTSSPSKGNYGEFQNIFAIAADSGLNAETVITIDGSDYIAFPNIWRNNTYAYAVIKKE